MMIKGKTIRRHSASPKYTSFEKQPSSLFLVGVVGPSPGDESTQFLILLFRFFLFRVFRFHTLPPEKRKSIFIIIFADGGAAALMVRNMDFPYTVLWKK